MGFTLVGLLVFGIGSSALTAAFYPTSPLLQRLGTLTNKLLKNTRKKSPEKDLTPKH